MRNAINWRLSALRCVLPDEARLCLAMGMLIDRRKLSRAEADRVFRDFWSISRSPHVSAIDLLHVLAADLRRLEFPNAEDSDAVYRLIFHRTMGELIAIGLEHPRVFAPTEATSAH